MTSDNRTDNHIWDKLFGHVDQFRLEQCKELRSGNYATIREYNEQPLTSSELCSKEVEMCSLNDDAVRKQNTRTNPSRYPNFGKQKFQKTKKTIQDDGTALCSFDISSEVSFGKKKRDRPNKKNVTKDNIRSTDDSWSQGPSRDDANASKTNADFIDEITKNVFAAKLAPANRIENRKELLLTNHFEIQLNPIQLIFRYDVDLLIVIEKHECRKEVNLTKGRDNSADTRDHVLMREVLMKALETYRILSEHGAFVYDHASILFTNENLAASLKPHHGSLRLQISELTVEIRNLIRSDNATELIIKIQPCRDFSAQFTLGDAQDIMREGKTDKALLHFLHLLTNQDAINRNAYICYGAGELFLNDMQLEQSAGKNSGHIYKKGVRKGIRFIQGHTVKKRDHSLVAALILDASLCTFYKSDHLLTIMCEINGWRNPSNAVWDRLARERSIKYLSNVRLRFTQHSGDFMALSISNYALKDILEEDNELKIKSPVLEKYVDQKILYPNWPAVIQKTYHGNVFHSMEVLWISANQRVPLHKQSSEKHMVEKPNARWKEIMNHLRALNLMGEENQLMNRFGVCIIPKPIQVEGFRRHAPHIIYNNVSAVVDKDKMNWKTRGLQFEVGGKIDVLFYTYDLTKGTPHPDCCGKIVAEAKKKGICIKKVINEKMSLEFELNNVTSTRSVFAKAESFVNSGQNVLIVYVDPEACKTHGKLKLLEARFQIPTQHLTNEVAFKIATGSPITLEMFLMKLNCKTFGINHVVIPDKLIKENILNKALIIGLDVAHPTGLSASQTSREYPSEFPSVIGFSANCAIHLEMFVGDYVYQKPLREKIDGGILFSLMQRILEKWRKNRGSLPEDIWIIRDGVSEGQYDMVLTEEIAAIQKACDKFSHDYRPRFAAIIVTKRHNKRFFKMIGSSIENPKAGTVVDTHIVRPDITEFFLQSHTAILGTAKASAYTLLRSDMPELTQDTLQHLMMALCFQHQICTSPISIPEPVYQADEWAKRGNDVFRAYKEYGFKVPRKGRDDNDLRAEYDWDLITETLSYKGKRLEFIRVNA